MTRANGPLYENRDYAIYYRAGRLMYLGCDGVERIMRVGKDATDEEIFAAADKLRREPTLYGDLVQDEDSIDG